MGKGEREGKKHQCVIASHMPPLTGDPVHNPHACAPPGNQIGDTLVRRPALNPLSHTSQGLKN